MAAQTTATLTNEMMVYYEKVFLDRAKYAFIFDQGAQKKTHSQNNGKQINFTRYSPLSVVTTALTEGVNPSEVNISAATVTVNLAEYGNSIRVSKLLSLTSIDMNSKEKVELLGQNMGESLDQLVREELFTGAAVQFANSRASLATIAAGDILTATETRRAARTLKNNKAMPYPDGSFMAKISPYTSFDMMNDTVWVNAHTYKDGDNLYNGEIGKLFGVRFVESVNPKSEASTVTVYSNFFHGANAFGTYQLDGDQPKMYIKTPGPNSTDNPADRFSMLSWAGNYTVKTLNGAWVLNVKTSAGA